MSAATSTPTAILGDPRLRRALARSVGRRVDATDIDDVVQTTLAEAVAAKALPQADVEVRRFVFAIARQKVADMHRRRGRERRRTLPEAERETPPPSNDVRQWLERILPGLPGAERTFAWILREAEGETLAEIAAADGVSPAMVRQRVSRLRRWLRERWMKEVSVVALLVVVAAALGAARVAEPVARTEPAEPGIRAEPQEAPPEPDTGMLTPRSLRKLLPPPSKRAPAPPPRAFPPPATSFSPPPGSASAPRATIVGPERWRRAPDGTVVRESPPELKLPAIDLRSCATPSSRRGIGQVAVTFLPAGTVASVEVTGPFTQAEIACIAQRYRRVVARPQSGPSDVTRAYVTLVPEPPPPAWTAPP